MPCGYGEAASAVVLTAPGRVAATTPAVAARASAAVRRPGWLGRIPRRPAPHRRRTARRALALRRRARELVMPPWSEGDREVLRGPGPLGHHKEGRRLTR